MKYRSRGIVILVGLILSACQDDPNAPSPRPTSITEPASPDIATVATSSDRDVLVTFYDATGGPRWKNNTNWLSVLPLDTWYGVETNMAGRVTRIDLNDNKLAGRIPRELAELAKLEYLNLRDNRLTGPIPPELGSLANLDYLDLYVNRLSGRIPPELTELHNLTHLMLGFNRLTGPIPAAFGSMRRLEKVWFNHNQLSGPIPMELGNLGEQLEWLDVQHNEGIVGPLPFELTRLTELSRFEWGNTGLCSPPDEALQMWLSRAPTHYGRGPACGSWVGRRAANPPTR